jgi:hypothetical protein
MVRHLTSSLRHLTAKYLRHFGAVSILSGNSVTFSGKCDIRVVATYSGTTPKALIFGKKYCLAKSQKFKKLCLLDKK